MWHASKHISIMSISLGNNTKGHFNNKQIRDLLIYMHPGRIHVIIALKGFSFPLRSTFDTFLTILLNCNLNETCMFNQRGSLPLNLWKCCAGCRLHLHLSRYSSMLGNWLLIAAINMWWLSASNSCSISTGSISCHRPLFLSQVISRACESCSFSNDISTI